MKHLVCAATAVTLALGTAHSREEAWPRFRGPGARGTTPDSGLPDTWSTTENVVWKIDVPGRGWSSPIFWGQRVFLTTAISAGEEETPKKGLYLGGDRHRPSTHEHRYMVYCLDWKDGSILWQREARRTRPPGSRHIKNSHASETPCTDGERVYAYFGNVGLFAYTLEGKLVWSRQWEPVKTRAGWGTAASPVVHEGRVYLLNDNEDGSFLEALDSVSGTTVWRVDRDEKSNWSTPLVWENDRRAEIVTSGTGAIRSYDLQGKLLWQLRGMSSITIPAPFAEGDLLYIGSGFVMDRERPLYAIRPGASGDITLAGGATSSEFVAWAQRQAAPYNPTPIVFGDQIYVLLDRGFLTSYDRRTGEPIYGKQRLERGATAFTASPWAYDGKVFCLSEDGDTFVVQAGPDFRVLRKNSLEEMCMATPAIAHGNLLIRTLSQLYRIGRTGAKRETTAGS